jgi:hypothetical protein
MRLKLTTTVFVTLFFNLLTSTIYSQTEISSNSAFFSVNNYYYPDADGNYQRYRVSGFYEKVTTPTVQPRLFVLPQIYLNREKIQYIDSEGNTVDSSTPSNQITNINIPLSYSGALPTTLQSIGVAAQIGGTSQDLYIPKPLMNPDGSPLIYPPAYNFPQTINQIHADFNAYKNNMRVQEDNLQVWKKFRVEMTALNEVVLSLLVDGEIISTRQIPGSTLVIAGNTLPTLPVQAATPRQVNRIKSGSFELQISYRFKDSKVGSINASFDAKRTSDSYISETQRAITQNKSSGFKVLGIGYRRSKLKQSLDQSVTQRTSELNMANTVIVMDDADEDMIEQFEAQFFPSLSKQSVIEDHLRAAAVARAGGDTGLAKVHEDYASALRRDDELAEVDAVGAAAALSAGDYAGFIAKGVRAQLSDDNRSNNFSRVISISSNQEDSTTWSQLRRRSVQRAVTILVTPEEKPRQEVRIGICGGFNVNNPPQVVLTCVVEGSPLARAGVVPGSSIISIDGRSFTSITELTEILNSYKPGDAASIRLIEPQGYVTKIMRFTKGKPISR